MGEVMTTEIGVLYTGPMPGDPYDEYETFMAALPGGVAARIAFSRSDAVHSRDVIVQTGDLARMEAALATIRSHPLRSVVFACTCGSFAYGPEGSRRQAEGLARLAGVPASTTSQAFVAAVRALRLRRVAILATYPPDVARLFGDLIEDAGASVVAMRCLEMATGRDSNQITAAELTSYAVGVDRPEADAVLIPDTAVRSLDVIEALEARLGKPVLTANQVTGWRSIRLAGLDAVQPRFGHLMAQYLA
jgi:maleate cis-trans isomerase